MGKRRYRNIYMYSISQLLHGLSGTNPIFTGLWWHRERTFSERFDSLSYVVMDRIHSQSEAMRHVWEQPGWNSCSFSPISMLLLSWADVIQPAAASRHHRTVFLWGMVDNRAVSVVSGGDHPIQPTQFIFLQSKIYSIHSLLVHIFYRFEYHEWSHKYDYFVVAGDAHDDNLSMCAFMPFQRTDAFILQIDTITCNCICEIWW